MTDTGEDQTTVSQNRYQAVVAERDGLQKQVDELATTVKDFGYQQHAQAHFEQGGVANPQRWADRVLPHIRSLELDEVNQYLDDNYDDLPKVAATDALATAADTAPAEPPRPAVAGPNPAAPGEPVSTQTKLKSSDPEFKAILQSEGYDGMRRLIREGRYEHHPQNTIGQGLTKTVTP